MSLKEFHTRLPVLALGGALLIAGSVWGYEHSAAARSAARASSMLP